LIRSGISTRSTTSEHSPIADRNEVVCGVILFGLPGTQAKALDFARCSFRKVGEEFNPVRPLENRQSLEHKLL
jgi:hypothetical protein